VDSQFRQPLQERDKQVRRPRRSTGIPLGAVDRRPQGSQNGPPGRGCHIRGELGCHSDFHQTIDLHHHDEVRHLHLLQQEPPWMTHCLSTFETCLFHGKVTKDVSGVDVRIVLTACIIRLHHPCLRKVHYPRQQFRQVQQTCHRARVRAFGHR